MIVSNEIKIFQSGWFVVGGVHVMFACVQFWTLGPDLEEFDRFLARSVEAAGDTPVSPAAIAVEDEARDL